MRRPFQRKIMGYFFTLIIKVNKETKLRFVQGPQIFPSIFVSHAHTHLPRQFGLHIQQNALPALRLQLPDSSCTIPTATHKPTTHKHT